MGAQPSLIELLFWGKTNSCFIGFFIMKLKIGDKIPSFTLLNQEGKEVKSAELVGKANLVIYFYPKDDTPGCTKEACSFRDNFEEFTDLGAQVIGISADSPKSHTKFASKYNLPFTLLSDNKNEVRKAFGLKGSLFGLLPGRVTYIVDKSGVVQYIFDSQFNALQHVSTAKEVLKKL